MFIFLSFLFYPHPNSIIDSHTVYLELFFVFRSTAEPIRWRHILRSQVGSGGAHLVGPLARHLHQLLRITLVGTVDCPEIHALILLLVTSLLVIFQSHSHPTEP